MRSVIGALKRRHAVYAGKLRAAALVAVWIEFLLSEDVAAALQTEMLDMVHLMRRRAWLLTSHWKETISGRVVA